MIRQHVLTPARQPAIRADHRFDATRLEVEQAMDRAEQHLESEALRGFDPYDALSSPLFSLPGLRSQRLLRFGAQQLVKRSPWNLRGLLRIRKQLNPVSVGLYLQGQAQRAAGRPASRERRRDRANEAVRGLAATASPGYSGSCWGYPFDWETRHGPIPAGTPTVVATGMVANGLWAAHEHLGLRPAGELLVDAAEFVMRDLHRLPGADGTFCWTYSPSSRQAVLNATLKGSRLLAQAHALGGRDELLQAAADSVAFVLAHQLRSGAWPYSLADPRRDNFHTGYVLECLRTYRDLSGDRSADEAIERGWLYYRRRFFTDRLVPKYYDDRVDPLDATACAQAIITLCEFGDLDAAAAVGRVAIELLGRGDGSFAYQRRGGRTMSTPFLRWSTAWMYCALSRLSVAFASARGSG
jgi:hypothetical protein